MVGAQSISMSGGGPTLFTCRVWEHFSGSWYNIRSFNHFFLFFQPQLATVSLVHQLWLCVVFGLLFLVMLCINVFLCSTMTYSFSRTEVDLVEDKTPSVYTVQDYDPYRGWAGSQYGSRFSLGHPGTWPLSATDNGRPLGPDHPGTRVLGTPSMTYTSLQNTKST